MIKSKKINDQNKKDEYGHLKRITENKSQHTELFELFVWSENL